MMCTYWYSYIVYPEYFVCRGGGIASSLKPWLACACLLVLAFIVAKYFYLYHSSTCFLLFIFLPVVLYKIFRLLIGVPDYSSVFFPFFFQK